MSYGASPPPSLGDLARVVASAEVRGDASGRPADVTLRAEDVVRGSLFFCVRGRHVDGHGLAANAVARGAAALVVDAWQPIDIAQIRVPDVREAMGPMSAAHFGHPSRRLRSIGVTGTNGKTTVTYLLESILRADGALPGVVGTTGARVGGTPVALARTTPEAPDLQRLLARMVAEGVGAVAMEVSSHGLDQHRVDGTHFDVVAFTNLTRDHLDYHATMEEYFAAKARLFTRAFAERAVVDIDTAWGRRMASASEVPVLTFGTSPDADVRARDVEATRDGLAFRVDGLRVAAPLLGDFNASNVLAAIAAARAAGIPEDAILHGVAAVDPVPGRAERVDAGQPFLVLVDYAHTPDGLDNVLLAAGRLAAARVVAVFGCGGDRDRAKRPMMGLAATTRADLTIVTSDNPRSEDPAGIIDDIVRGARDGGRDFVVEPDRRAAIRRAVATAREGDVVVIAGKGHESTQEIAGRAVPFDDRVVAREEIEALGDRDAGEGAS